MKFQELNEQNVQLDWTAASRAHLIPFPDQSRSNEQGPRQNKRNQEK